MNLSRKLIKNLIKSSQAIHLRLKIASQIQSKYNFMGRNNNKGLNIKNITSLRKDKKRHIPKVEHKETKNIPPSNSDKISVILINNIIDKPISKFTEKVNDTNIFSLGISFVKRLNFKLFFFKYML